MLPRAPAGIPAREGSLQAAAPKFGVPMARLLRRERAEQRQVATGWFYRSPAARCLQSHLTLVIPVNDFPAHLHSPAAPPVQKSTLLRL